MKSKASNVISYLRKDQEIRLILKQAKRIKTYYKLYRKEIDRFLVGAAKFKNYNDYEFEKTIEKVRRIQAYLDRLVEIRSILLGTKGMLVDLYQTGSVLLGSYDSVQKIRTTSQRDDLIDEILVPLARKRDRIEELLDVIENMSWNLKHTFNIIDRQTDWAKTVYYMRNPEKRLSK